jgi:glycosyltransferase involved in cell wall biosynthesis
MTRPKFTIVTACKNAARHIQETVNSVLSQTVFRSGQCELEYLVYDGASTDGTLELLRAYESKGVSVASERDSGMYAALAKGLQRATGDFVAYLNAGDFYHPGGLSIAAECFELPGVNWLTGYAVTYNDQSQLTACFLPFRYRRSLLACGAYGTLLPYHLQQESTVWRRSLHASVDFDFLRSLRLAGDSYLWKCFASLSDVDIVAGHIGGFRVHPGQLSERADEYRKEIESFRRSPSASDRLQCLVDRAFWAAPQRVKAWGSRPSLIFYDHSRQAWRRARRAVPDGGPA